MAADKKLWRRSAVDKARAPKNHLYKGCYNLAI
jgi:hypothetical protein